MENLNIYVILTPLEHLARDAFRLEHNRRFFSGADIVIATKPEIGSREPTPAPQVFPAPAAEYLFWNLDSKVKQRGIVKFGTNPDQNDCLLGHRGTNGISNTHFLIFLDRDFKVRLRDESSWGTTVRYDGRERPDYDNCLAYCPGSPNPWKEVSVHLPNGISFKIDFPNHETAHPEYLQNLHAFIHGNMEASPLDTTLQQLGFDSALTTAAPSHLQTPRQQTLYIDDGILGKGKFGVVKRVIKADSRENFAAKYFKRPRILDRQRWLLAVREEVRIMREHPHENILRVIDFFEFPSPVLITPLCLGSLDQFTFAEEQCVTIFRQILSGLHHLHEHKIVHRDLKPENILFTAPCTILLADFGLSKAAEVSRLTTFCGTMLYTAPEIYALEGYSFKSDIWSAGIIIIEIMYKLPSFPRKVKGDDILETRRHSLWCNELQHYVEQLDEDGDQVVEILCRMVIITAEDRFTAEMCLEKGCENGLFRMRRDGKLIGGDDTEINTPVEGTPTASIALELKTEVEDTPRAIVPEISTLVDEAPRTTTEKQVAEDEARTTEEAARSALSEYRVSRKRPRSSSSQDRSSHASAWTVGFETDSGLRLGLGEIDDAVYLKADRFSLSFESTRLPRASLEAETRTQYEFGELGPPSASLQRVEGLIQTLLPGA